MFKTDSERFGDLSVIHCQGRIVQDAAVFQLRNAVCAVRDSTSIILDLSDVEALEGGGVGMLLFLQRWAGNRGISLRIFDPPDCVRRGLKRFSASLEIASTAELIESLSRNDAAVWERAYGHAA